MTDLFSIQTALLDAPLPLPSPPRWGRGKMGRVTGITHALGANTVEAMSYVYDAAGNRSTVTRANAAATLQPPALTASYNAGNQQIQFNSGTANEVFDANGNLTSFTDGSGTTTYTWDVRNRLTAISGPGLTTSFTYDGQNRRKSKTINSVTTNYQYDGDDIVAETGATTASYLRGLSIDEPFIRQGATNEFYQADALGSTLALTDAAGIAQTTYISEPFGKTTVTGTSTNPFQYTGRENDGTGLYYYRARYYGPQLQRFLEEDPIGFFGGDLNLYAYVKINPANFIDPPGLMPFQFIVVPSSGTPSGINRLARSPDNALIPLPPIPYGNYGGKGWTGGYTGRRGPIDSLDECFKDHDDCYGKSTCPQKKMGCDAILVACLRNLPNDPRDWKRPAPNAPWATTYRFAADFYFR